MAVQLCYINVLENASVSIVSAATASTAAPLARTYDRDLGKVFETQSSAALTIRINQGTSAVSVDRLIIANHNLSGLTVEIKKADTTAVSTFIAAIVATTAPINSTFAATTSVFFEISVTGLTTTAQIGEIFLTRTYAWEHDPLHGGALDDVFNVDNIVTSGGQDRFIEYGSPKRQRNYSAICETAQSTSLTAFNSAWAGKKPFWLNDHTGEWIYSKLTQPINLESIDAGVFTFDFKTLEVLP